jgi:hypothetical protein
MRSIASIEERKSRPKTLHSAHEGRQKPNTASVKFANSNPEGEQDAQDHSRCRCHDGHHRRRIALDRSRGCHGTGSSDRRLAAQQRSRCSGDGSAMVVAPAALSSILRCLRLPSVPSIPSPLLAVLVATSSDPQGEQRGRSETFQRREAHVETSVDHECGSCRIGDGGCCQRRCENHNDAHARELEHERPCLRAKPRCQAARLERGPQDWLALPRRHALLRTARLAVIARDQVISRCEPPASY